MANLIPDLVAAEMVVFVTPLYYSGMSAQLKAVIDRFYSINSILRATPKQAMLLCAGADKDLWPMEALETHFRAIFRYLKWQFRCSLLAVGVHERQDIEQTGYPRKHGLSVRKPG